MIDPLVTCICPTMPGRESWLRKAIDCFESQDYENVQMLIVCDQDQGFPDCSFDLGCDPAITFMASHTRTLGEKRNLACQAAAGEFIAHFDDDDWSAPGRITDQINRLRETGKAVTGYRILKFTDGRRWWKLELPSTRVYGTTLCYRRDWWRKNQFGNVTESADNAFCAKAGKELIGADAGDLMYATNHPGNTTERTPPPAWMETEAVSF